LRGDEVFGMLWAKATVHQTVRQPQRAGGKAVAAEVARLPSLDPTRLNCPEDRAAMLPAATVAAAVRAYQAYRRGGFGGEQAQVDIEEIFVSIEL
jgi:hypothetical protein